jgi:hypothetical protein
VIFSFNPQVLIELLIVKFCLEIYPIFAPKLDVLEMKAKHFQFGIGLSAY